MEPHEIKDALDGYHDLTAKGLEKLGEQVDGINTNQRELADRLLSLEQRGAGGGYMPQAQKKYSLLNVVRKLADGKADVDVGREMEWHQELQHKGMQAPPGAILVPSWALGLERKDVTYAGTGANLVDEQYMGGDLIDVLRAQSIVAGLGATILTGLSGDVAIPKKTAGHTGYWFTGDGGDSITESTPAFDQISLKPTFLGGVSSWSYKLLTQASPAVEELARRDLIDTLTTAMDAAAIQGTGAANQPVGIINQPGISSTTYAAGGAPDFVDVVALETAVRAANVQGELGYATTPDIAGALKTADKAVGAGVFVLEGTQINGMKTAISNNVPAGYLICGNWSDLLIGLWGEGIAIAVDQSTGFASGSVRVRGILGCDVKVRHAESFSEIHSA